MVRYPATELGPFPHVKSLLSKSVKSLKPSVGLRFEISSFLRHCITILEVPLQIANLTKYLGLNLLLVWGTIIPTFATPCHTAVRLPRRPFLTAIRVVPEDR